MEPYWSPSGVEGEVRIPFDERRNFQLQQMRESIALMSHFVADGVLFFAALDALSHYLEGRRLKRTENCNQNAKPNLLL